MRELRAERDLSQEELGQRAGLHRNYIGGVERGERNIARAALLRLAAGLDVPLAELVVHAKALNAYLFFDLHRTERAHPAGGSRLSRCARRGAVRPSTS